MISATVLCTLSALSRSARSAWATIPITRFSPSTTGNAPYLVLLHEPFTVLNVFADHPTGRQHMRPCSFRLCPEVGGTVAVADAASLGVILKIVPAGPVAPPSPLLGCSAKNCRQWPE